jgi:hypothetical protein
LSAALASYRLNPAVLPILLGLSVANKEFMAISIYRLRTSALCAAGGDRRQAYSPDCYIDLNFYSFWA